MTAAPTPEMLEAFTAMDRFTEELVAAGVFVAAAGLKNDAHAKRVVSDGGARSVIDGPFAESRELIAGFSIWEVKDMDEALAWARRAPRHARQDRNGDPAVLRSRGPGRVRDAGGTRGPARRRARKAGGGVGLARAQVLRSIRVIGPDRSQAGAGLPMTVQKQIDAYIAAQPEAKRADMRALHRLLLRAMPKCKLWFLDGKNGDGKTVSNPNIGYGHYTMTYAGGKTRDFYQIGVSANTTGISGYILGIPDKTHLSRTYAKTLGKARVSGYCIKFKTLDDIDTDVLAAAIKDGVAQTREL